MSEGKWPMHGAAERTCALLPDKQSFTLMAAGGGGGRRVVIFHGLLSTGNLTAANAAGDFGWALETNF